MLWTSRYPDRLKITGQMDGGSSTNSFTHRVQTSWQNEGCTVHLLTSAKAETERSLSCPADLWRLGARSACVLRVSAPLRQTDSPSPLASLCQRTLPWAASDSGQFPGNTTSKQRRNPLEIQTWNVSGTLCSFSPRLQQHFLSKKVAQYSKTHFTNIVWFPKSRCS